MKQEILEKAAEQYAKQFDYAEDSSAQLDFIEGAKWQQERMYSEEDMQEYSEFCIRLFMDGTPCVIAKDWFEKIKKK